MGGCVWVVCEFCTLFLALLRVTGPFSSGVGEVGGEGSGVGGEVEFDNELPL